MPLITRQGKGTKLTIQEMDGNLIYLENLASIGITGGTGPIGPQGATGPFRLPGSIRNDAFTGSTITINHGYGYYPMVQIINDEGELIVPDNITHSSVNSYTVDFGVTVSGTIITGVSDGLRFTGGGTAISFGSSDIHAWGNIIPTSNDNYNLGSSESRWNNLYVKDIFVASQSLYLGTVKLADNDGELVIEKSVDGGAISTISLSVDTKYLEGVSISQNSSLILKSPTTTIYGMNVGAPLPSPNQFFIQVTGENLNGDPTEIAFLISKTDAYGDRTLWWDDTLPPAPQFFVVPIPKHSSKKIPQSSPYIVVPIPKHSSGGTLKRSSYSTKKLKFTGVSSNDTTKNVSYEYPILSVELLDGDTGYVVWCPISAGAIPQIYQDLNYSFSVLETSEEISKSKLYQRTDSIDWADSGYNDPTGFDYQIDGSSISVSFNFKGATAPWIYDVKSLVKFRDVALTIRDTTNDDNQIDLIVTNVEDDTVSGSGGIVEFTRIDGRITNLPVGASFSFDSNSAIEYKPIETKFIESVSTSQNSSLLVKSPTTTIYDKNVGAPLPSPNQFYIQVTGENLNGDPTEIAFLISKTDAIGDRSIWWDDTLPPAPQFVVVPIPKHSSKKVSSATPPTSQIFIVPIPKHSSGGGTLKRSSYSTKKLKFTGVSSNDTTKNVSYEYPILSVDLLDGDTGYVVWCPISAGNVPQIYQDLNYSFSILETSEEISKSKLYQRTDSIDWADSGFNNPTGFDYQIDGSSISVSFNFKGATAPWIYDVKSLVKFRDVALTIRDTTNDDNQIDLIVTNIEDDTVSGSGGIVEFTRIDGRITNLPVGASFSFDSNSAIEYKPIETKFIESVSTSQNSSLLVKSPTPTIYGMNVGAPLPSPNQFYIQITSENLNGDPTEIAFLISKTDAIGDRSIWWDDTLPPAPQFFFVPIPKHSSKKVSGATPPTSQIVIVPIPKHSSGGGTLKRSSYSTKKLKFTGVSSNDTSKNLSYEYPILSVELLADESGYVVWCPIAAGAIPQIYQDLNYSFSVLETSEEISKSKLYSRTDSIDWADIGYNDPTGFDYQIDGSSISVSFNFKGATAPWIYDVKSLTKYRDVALTIRDTTNDDNQIDLIVTNVEDDTVSGSGGIVEFTRIDGRITNLPVGASFSFDSNSTIEYKPIETKFIESVSTSQNSSLLVKSPTPTIYGMNVGAPLPSPNQFFIQVTGENLNGDPTEIAFLISKTDAIGDRSIWWDDTLPPAPQYFFVPIPKHSSKKVSGASPQSSPHVQVPIPKHSSGGGTLKRSSYSTKKLKFTGVSSNDTTKNVSYEYPILSVELLDGDTGYVVWCPIAAGAIPQIYQDLNYSFSVLETSEEISKSKLYQRTDSIDWADSGYNDPTGFDYQIDGSSISVSFNFKGATAPWIYDVKSLIKYRDVALTIRDTDNDDSQIDFIVTNVEDDTVSGSGGIVEFTRIDGIISSLSINGWTFGATSLSFDSNSTIEYKALDPISSALKLSNGFVQSEYPLILGPVTNAGGPRSGIIKLKPRGTKDLSIGVGPITSTASGQTVSMVDVLGDGIISNTFILGDWTDPVTNTGGQRGIIKLKPKGSKDLSIGVGAIGSTASGETFSAVEVYGDGLVSNAYLFGSWIDSDGDIDTGFGATGSTASGTTFSAVEVIGDGIISSSFILGDWEDYPVTLANVRKSSSNKTPKTLRVGIYPIGSTAGGETYSAVEITGEGVIASSFVLGNWEDYPVTLANVRKSSSNNAPKTQRPGIYPIGSTAGGETYSAVEITGEGIISSSFILGDWEDYPVTLANVRKSSSNNAGKTLRAGIYPIGSTAGGETFSAVEITGDGLLTNQIYLYHWGVDDVIDTGFGATGSTASGTTFSVVEVFGDGLGAQNLFLGSWHEDVPVVYGRPRWAKQASVFHDGDWMSIGFGSTGSTASGTTQSFVEVIGDGVVLKSIVFSSDEPQPLVKVGTVLSRECKLLKTRAKFQYRGSGLQQTEILSGTPSGETFSFIDVLGDGLVSNNYLLGSWIDSNGDIDTGFGATGSTASGTTFSAVEVIGNGIISDRFFLNNPLGPVTNTGAPRGIIKLKPKGSKDLSIGVGPIGSTASGQTVSMVDVLGDGIISNTFILGDWTDPVTNSGGQRGIIKLKPKGSKDLSIGVGAIGSTASGETFSAVEVLGDGLVSNTYLFGSWIDSDGDIDTGFGATGSTASGTTQSFVEVFGDGLVSQSLVIGNLDDGITMNRYDGILTIGGGSNTIATQSNYSSIIGGACNLLCGTSKYSSIIGGCCNIIATQSSQSSIIGGYCNTLQYNSCNSSIIGGRCNTILESQWSSILGGLNSCIDTTILGSVVGGESNIIDCVSARSVIMGSYISCISGTSQVSAIIAGKCNTINDLSLFTTIQGGYCNRICSSAQNSSILGGECNLICQNCNSSIVGGVCNTLTGTASNSVILGGQGLSFSNVCDRVIVPTIILASASTERPHINFVSGASVSSPQNGDVWFDGNNLYIRINGQTKQFNLT